MEGLLKKIMPISKSMSGKDFDDDVFNSEFSIAIEYTGSPVVDHSLPRVFPVDIDQIPTAKIASNSPVFVNNLSLTVVQPIGGGRNTIRVDKEVRLGSPVTPLNERLTDDDDHSDGGFHHGSDRRDDKVVVVGSSGSLEEDSDHTLGFSDSGGLSNELSESSDMVESPRNRAAIRGFRDGDWGSDESSSVPRAFPMEITCEDDEEEEEEEESDGERLQSRRTRKKSVVTLCEFESGETGVSQESEDDDNLSIDEPERPVAVKPGKTGQCYYCHKGNRFTEKESCIVCNAKYCRKCVLRAMGSMPEGRKCIGCIGFPVEDSKREVCGRSSRLLRKLLHESQVKLIMDAELSSSESVYVNGVPLSSEELNKLQNCPNPPRSLKPGKYWYDKIVGFWGKEGHKPSQIITPNLGVGGDRLREDASNGNTNITINNRKISKYELWMLKSAGVQCPGNIKIDFFMEPNGTYAEVGMDRTKDSIWSKKRTKFLCTLLSLPTPAPPKPQGKSDQPVVGATPVSKILLVGNDQSGTSTIYKQARVLYGVPFDEKERENIKIMIQTSLYGYLARLLEGREQFEEESLILRRRRSADEPGPSAVPSEVQDRTEYSIGSRLKVFSDWLIDIMLSGNLDIIVPAATREYAPYVEELWKNAAIQATYSRRDELQLPRVATYFLDRAVEIAKVEYEPSDTDILYAEGITTSDGLVSMELFRTDKDADAFRNPEEKEEPESRYELVRVHARSVGHNCKCLHMFADVRVVLFCVSLTEYDEYEVNSSGVCVNRMLETRKLFENIVTQPVFEDTNFLLVLNKLDLLEEKIADVPLTKCEWFRDFNPVVSRHQSSTRSNGNAPTPLAQTAFHYIAVKFKRLFTELTGRKLYVCPATALEADTVDGALKYAREIVRWKEDKPNYSLNEFSTESIEPSTYSSF